MANYRAESADRFNKAFGIIPDLSYLPGVLGNEALNKLLVNKKGKAYQKQNQIPATDYRRGKYALANTFDNIIIEKPNFYEFPLDPIVDLAWGFNNVITEMTGGSAVLERTGSQLMTISIKGIIWDGSETYPEEEVKKFLATFRKSEIYTVNSKIFNIYGIKQFFVEDITMNALDGVMDTQPYEIKAFEYIPVELNITAVGDTNDRDEFNSQEIIL
jgi:hypothetical protein